MGFWLHGDRVAGSLFDDPTDAGARQLVMWGLLRGGRLWPQSSCFSKPDTRSVVLQCAQNQPHTRAHDAVVDRRLGRPTELTTDEIAMLFPTPPEPEMLLGAQHMLQKVGITWPGSPEIPELPSPPQPRINPFTGQPMPVVEDESFHDMTALGLARGDSLRRR